MQRSHKLLHSAAQLRQAPAVLAFCGSFDATLVNPACCSSSTRQLFSHTQPELVRGQHHSWLRPFQQLSKPSLPLLLPQNPHRQLFGIGEADDTHKDYKERRLIGYSSRSSALHALQTI